MDKSFTDVQTKKLKEFCNKLAERIITVLNWVVETVRKFWATIKQNFRSYVGIIYKLPGYRRMEKAEQIKIWEQQATNKSNNWRKMHCIPLIRNIC